MSQTSNPRDADVSAALFARACQRMPGGVNSPVRAFRAVGGAPRFIDRARGARVWDVDGREYLDYLGAWGPMILGHGHAGVVAALERQLRDGTAFGSPTRLEVEMAETLGRLVPMLEKVRMVNSGTEATMAAVRVARGATGRPLIVKFDGCYHGHADGFLVKAGSGAATFGAPDSLGVTPAATCETLTARYNDLADVQRCFVEHPGAIAAVIVEPVAGNMGVVAPGPGFLEGLRALTARAGALLVFDEVMTGFRVAPGGAQQRYGVRADLVTLGKIIGGGLPVGAYGGRADLMGLVSPEGPVYQAGTMSGNPLSMAAGLAALSALEADPGLYDRLEALGARLEAGIRRAIESRSCPCSVNRVGSMWTLFFTTGPVRDWSSASLADRHAFGRFFQAMLAQGVSLAPSQFEANFISAAHSPEDIDQTVSAIEVSLDAAWS